MHWFAAHQHAVEAYWYEILGGMLIFYSSAVTETAMPKDRRRLAHWFTFGFLAVVYIAFGIAIRHDEVQQNDRNSQRSEEDRKELRENRGRMDSRMDSVLASFQVTYSQLGSLSSEIAVMRTGLLRAMHKNDPQVITSLQQQAQAAQVQVDNLSRELLALTMAPQIAGQLLDWNQEREARQQDLHNREWEEQTHFRQERPGDGKGVDDIMARWQIKYDKMDEEYAVKLKGLVATADFVRRELLQRLSPQQIDKLEEQQFAQAIKDPLALDRKAAAAYLEELARRVPTPK
jgi:hypothetical protein